jgi:plastocyanin
VRRLLGTGSIATIAALALALAAAPGASATNTRVSIAHYAWSNPEIHIDLGEKVTWDWLGPDLAHSVTGVSADAVGWDSDPGTDAPYHPAGYSYTIQFNQPGIYQFRCKLHPVVRGDVVVSETPGDPNSDPGPQPPLNVDVTPPTLSGLALARASFHGAGGVRFSARISEKGTLDAEYYRLGPKGKRVYSGFKTWRASAGVNRLKLGARWKHFQARPGRYAAVLRASDGSANVSRPATARFTIAG